MVKRFQPVRANVGSVALRGSTPESIVASTLSVRNQMEQIVKNFEDFADHMRKSTKEVLLEAFRQTFEDSQILVPKDTGELARSGYLEAEVFPNRTVVEIGYGRNGHPYYAPIVHEDPKARHRAPEQYKFLQQPLQENTEIIRKEILYKLKQASGT